jgi:hypothetical protein
VADSLALEADEVKAVNIFVDLFAIEDPAFQLIDSNAQQLFVVSFYLTPAGFVTWKIFVFRFVMTRIIEIVVRAILCRSSRGFLLRSWHLADVFLLRNFLCGK